MEIHALPGNLDTEENPKRILEQVNVNRSTRRKKGRSNAAFNVSHIEP